MARTEFFDLLSKRQITIKVGDNEVNVGDAVEKLVDETAVTAGDIEALQTQIDELKAAVVVPDVAAEAPAAAEDRPADDDDVVLARMREELRSWKYKWRSIERLALLAGVSETRAHALLSQQADIQLGIGKSGRRIAKFADS